MANIFARSPYIVEINETGQVETKIEIYLWNTGSMPSAPQYILSKLIPATNAPATYYDVSPYVREFISHNSLQTQMTTQAATPTAQYCNFTIRKYKRVGTAFTQVGSDITGYGFEGFGYYTDGYNFDLFRVHLDQSTYNYYNDGSGDAGHITIETISGDSIKYTNLSTGATTTVSLGTAGVKDIPRVNSAYIAAGNLVELINGGTTLWRATFQPKAECKYTPVRCDFVNRYGANSFILIESVLLHHELHTK